MTWLAPLCGGVLIGCGAVLLMVLHGRIAGISGILGGLLPPPKNGSWEPDRGWRWAFLGGLVAGPPVVAFIYGIAPLGMPILSLPLMAAAGLLVGLGTGLGSGCTSGHGVCGLARLSGRSLVATLVFMATGMATVYLIRHVF
ncbi:MAG: YeeE/YedE family protein [Rhodospirillaceae bacterium]